MKKSHPGWLLLLPQLPNSPAYLRIKIWRRLQKIGAVAVKNAAYVLPRSEQSLEDFHWVAKEIVEGGGDASVCEANFVEGLTNDEIVELFRAARQEDYDQVLGEIRALRAETEGSSAEGAGWTRDIISRLSRLRQKLGEILAIDFFESSGHRQAESLLAQIEAMVRESSLPKVSEDTNRYSGKTWVTRKGVHVDRIASAWLIRRFIDRKARFKFVPARGYRPQKGEIRFDMFDAEFTHEGNNCSFEVLVARMKVSDRALTPIAEIIHDIDLKESKFGRAETAGVALVINSICRAHKEDTDRIERASSVLDDLYAFFRKP